MSEHLTKAVNGWGEPLPAWIDALARACDATSQSKTAKQIGYSAATVSMVLKGAYTGDLEAVQEAVNAHIMNAAVECPVAGNLPLAKCLEHQTPPDRLTNRRQVEFITACPKCPNYRKGDRPC